MTDSGKPVVVKLWDGATPGAKGEKPQDIPTLTIYSPPAGKANGTAIVIFPGGSYEFLAGYEGKDFAEYLSPYGITCYVLEYRLGSNGYHHPIQIGDASRALRYVRTHAAQNGIDPSKIGVMGSSAGGHLAATLLTHFDAGNPSATDPIERTSSRPDFGVLCYPVISLGPIGHAGTRHFLLGDNPDPALIEFLSNEKHVTPQTPPTYLFHTWTDDLVPVENSLVFASALNKNQVPFDLHVYQNGPHGIGLGYDSSGQVHPWMRDLLFWLKTRNLVG